MGCQFTFWDCENDLLDRLLTLGKRPASNITAKISRCKSPAKEGVVRVHKSIYIGCCFYCQQQYSTIVCAIQLSQHKQPSTKFR